MPKKTETRDMLVEKGFFPEVLPPCFDSDDLTRCFKGMINDVEHRKFHKRASSYIRYSGTKHDGNRRAYGTVNPIPYFLACNFISNKWKFFENKFEKSGANLSNLRLGSENEDRAIVVPTLSEITTKISNQFRYSPIILKTDISQFFPSIYTHSISWAAHGVNASKQDMRHDSLSLEFNQLDWFTQQCQNGQTRGVVVGPDVFRIIAEFISCEIDHQLFKSVGEVIVGAVRHVDDFYIGVRNEIDAKVVLSHLREILQNYELQLNDNKTQIICGLDSVDDVWAQELRSLSLGNFDNNYGFALDKAHEVAKAIKSQSPIKLMLRRFDKNKCYNKDDWENIEPKFQRLLFHYNHCTDYVCLMLIKRYAINRTIDGDGWSEAISLLIRKHISFNHHHEILWLLWVAFTCKLKISEDLVNQLDKVNNSHIKALVIAAYCNELFPRKPNVRLGNKLSSTDQNWLHNLIGKSLGYSNASFSGGFSQEFEHLAQKKVKLIDFEKHISQVAVEETSAISSSKYGYDAEEDDDEDFDF